MLHRKNAFKPGFGATPAAFKPNFPYVLSSSRNKPSAVHARVSLDTRAGDCACQGWVVGALALNTRFSLTHESIFILERKKSCLRSRI